MSDIVERLRAVGLDKKVCISDAASCWHWTGRVSRTGYGIANLPRNKGEPQRGTSAHRYVWTVLHGNLARHLQVCHKCDNRLCCNPAHLFIGTAKVNAIDKVQKGRCAALVGEANAVAKLAAKDVIAIRASTKGHRAVAREYGVSESNVRQIRSGKTWGHVPDMRSQA
jgi:hypothetical protein